MTNLLGDRTTDLVGGFRVMMETARAPRSNWTIHEVLHQWCLTAFNEDIEDETDFVFKTEARLTAHLIMEGHRKLLAVPPRAFVPLYKRVMSDYWWDVSEHEAQVTIKKMTELLNIP